MDPEDIQYAEHQRPSALNTGLSAQVSDIWLGNRGSGNEKRDFYWQMSLVVNGWPLQSNTILARSQTALEVGTYYDIEGQSFLNPGKGWKKSVILVSSATKVDRSGLLKRPTFSLLAQVKLTVYNRCLLYWTSWDDYEQETYGQTAVVECCHITKDVLNKKCFFTGEMQAGDHDNGSWVCGSVETFALLGLNHFTKENASQDHDA
jgi:hypothetical protein